MIRMKRHRKKINRMRGKRTHGAGASKNRRGKGSRMTHRRTFGTNLAHVLKYEPERIRIKGFFSLKKKEKAINVKDLEKLEKNNEVDVTKLGYGKVIGSGILKKPLKVIAYSFSRGAKEKIEKAGGQAIVLQ